MLRPKEGDQFNKKRNVGLAAGGQSGSDRQEAERENPLKDGTATFSVNRREEGNLVSP